MSMTLKPYRNYSEAFVVNGLFALSGTTGTRGSLVQVMNFVPGNPVGWDTNIAVGIAGVYSHRPSVPNKVQLAQSGALPGTVLGMMLYDVLDINPTDGRLLIYSDIERRHELQCVLSGEAVPIVSKGYFEAVGFDTSAGAAGPGSGIGVSNSGSGIMSVLASSSTRANGRIGTFLSPTGADGGALIYLDI